MASLSKLSTSVFKKRPLQNYPNKSKKRSRRTLVSVEVLEDRTAPAVLSGEIFVDANGNIARDGGEGPMAGVTVFLDTNGNGTLNVGEPSTATDVNGSYTFGNLAAGDYTVRQIVPTNFRQTAPTVVPPRLFSTNVTILPNSIAELNPANGQVTRVIPAPFTTGNTAMGMAFDGAVLFALESNSDVLYELNPDTGVVLDSTQLAPGGYAGLATLNGLVYVFDDATDVVSVFNPQTNTIVNSYDLNVVNAGNPQFLGALGEIIGPDRLLAFTTTGQVALLNPATGVISSSFIISSAGATGLTSVGQEIFVGNPNATIQVFNRAGTLQRTMTETFPVFSLGGYSADGAYRVTVTAAQVLTGLNFGNQSIFAEIRGTKFEDANANGVRDAGEGPLAGVTVYLDTNGNGVLNAGEPSMLTDAIGNYAFTGLLPGDYIVREIAPTNYRQTTPRVATPRLFSANVNFAPNAIVELNPTTGQVIRQFASPVPTGNGANGLAYDGTVLYYLESNTDVLYELNPDTGLVLDSTPMPPGLYSGLATLNGLVYAFEDGTDVVLVFNPQTNTTVSSYDLNNVNGGIQFSGTLGEIASPDRLMAYTTTGLITFIDPASGLITSSINVGSLNPVGLTSVGQEIFIGLQNTTIQVRNRSGTLLRTLTETFQVVSLGGFAADGAHRITLAPAQVRTGVDFGNQNILGQIRGVKFEDANGNGVRDSGEGPMAGVTIYLDTNGNGVLNAGEPSTTTDAAGNYAFTALQPGDYVVREVLPTNYRQTAPAVFPARLFSANVNFFPNAIVELNPTTGQVIRPFASPVPGGNGANGLAFNGTTLYYLESNTRVLYELNPDTGLVLDSTQLPSGQYAGLATLNGLVYVLEDITDVVLVFNPQTDTVVTSYDLNNVNGGISFSGTLGEIASPDRLLAYTSAGQIAFLDPATGLITSSFVVGSLNPTGLTSVGQEIFIGGPNVGIQVRNRAGAILRTMTETFQIVSLGGFAADGGQRITLAPAQIRTGVDFGNQNILGEIRGAKFEDANANGVRDSGEGPMAGVTVYLDSNSNGVLDSGEPSMLTDAGGNYAFTGLVPAEYVVREIVPPNFRQTAPAVVPARLFSANVNFFPNAIVELNPATGQVIRLFASPVPGGNGSNGLAYDGATLYFLESNTRLLYELNPDTGLVLDSTQMPFGQYTGLATLNGLVYAFEDNNDVILTFNPQTDLIVNSYDLNNVNGGIPFSGTLGEIASPDRLLAFTATNQIAFLDPATGVITSAFTPTSIPGIPTGLTSVGQEIFLGFPNSTIQVRNRAGALQRTMLETFQVLSLGGFAADGSHRITLAPTQIRTGVDFGNQNILGQILGSKFEDANGNGVRDSGEGPMAGVTVYLDSNGNSVLDSGEAFATTDAGGNYAFANLLPGDYVVREIVPATFRQTAPSVLPARLFSANVNFFPNAIVELNPTTGQVIRQFASPVPGGSGANGLAFDGTVLYYLESNTRVLYEINPDTGLVLDSTQMPIGQYAGLATLKGLVYAFEENNDVILTFNPQTDLIVNSYDLNNVNGGIPFNGTLGEIAFPDRLLAYTVTGQLAFLDPATGLITSSFNVGGPTPTGLTSVGQEIYIGYPNSTIQVRDRAGTLLRTMLETFQVLSLGGFAADGAHRFTQAPAQIRTGVDFGNQSVLGEIHGAKFEDANGNGVRDLGEGPLAGVTVYLDTNDNGARDSGEPAATTDASGNYAFTNLMPGDYIVREIVPTGYRQTAPAVSPARLFSANVNFFPNTIVELSPTTGQVIAQFAAPVAGGSGANGLAFDGSVLYYLESNTNVLYELNPDTGVILDFTQLTTGVYTGLATLNGLVYAFEDSTDIVFIFNPQTNTIVNSYDLNNVNGGIPFNGTLGEISSPDRLIGFTATNQIAFLDPATGLITGTFNLGSQFPTGMTSVGQEIYIGLLNSTIQVRDRAGNLLRTLTETFQILSLGGHAADGAHRITQAPAQIRTGVDFGNRNDAPVADAGGPYAVNEGSSVTLDASGTSDTEDPSASLTYLWDLDGDNIFGETGASAGRGNEVGVSPTFSTVGLDGPSTFTVKLRVFDTGGKSDEDTATIAIDNVAPSAAISGPPAGVRGQTLTFTLTASDPSPADVAAGFTFAIDWDGNGSVDQTVSGSGAGTLVSHVFTAAGNFVVKITATDKDLGVSNIATTPASISAVTLLADPTDPTKTALFVGGTTENDDIVLNGTLGQSTVEVLLGGQSLGSYSPTGLIVVFGQNGDDLLKALPNVGTGVWLFGDAGDDMLIGTNQDDLLVGGTGDDAMEGHQGDDVMIGGAGADTLVSRQGGGLLVAGMTAFDTNLAALAAVVAEWTRTDADYATRSAHLIGTTQGGLNGSVLFNSQTVFDDGDVDILVGKGGLDLIYAHLFGIGALDQIKDPDTFEDIFEL